MTFVGKALKFLTYIGIFKAIMLVFFINITIAITGFCIWVAILAVHAACEALYIHSPLTLAALPVILLFGIPTLGWLIYGIATTKWSDIKAVLNEPVWIKT